VRKSYTVRNLRPQLHTGATGAFTVGSTLTYDEAVAIVSHFVMAGAQWVQFEITHTDGRRWHWEMAGPNVTLKVDTPTRA
jgi:hypothetical protein